MTNWQLKSEYLQYFRDLIEGRAVESWHSWWCAHESELAGTLTRMEYLQLKFGKVKKGAEILATSGISFTWSAKGRREAIYADYSPEILGSDGRPSPQVLAARYNGAVGAFERGDPQQGEILIKKIFSKMRKVRDNIERAEQLCDCEFDASGYWQEGQAGVAGRAAMAIALWKTIARWKTDSDLELPAVENAQSALRRQGESW